MSYLLGVLETKKNRWNMRENQNAIIGVEIRRKRYNESMTLNDLCQDVCSPSYLCKIERNQIEANQTILEEILDRMSISESQQDMLFNFYNVLLESITFFVKKDKAAIERYINIGVGFENYRYQILTFIYNLLMDNMDNAEDINKEIGEIAAGMQDVDLLIYSVFSGVFQFKEKNYQEAIDIFMAVDGLYISNDLSYIRKKYLYLSSLMLAGYETKNYYDDLVNEVIRLGYYEEIEEIHYSMALFYLKSGSMTLFNDTFRLIHNIVYINSINYMIAYKDMDYSALYELMGKPVNAFCEYLGYTLGSSESKIDGIRHLSNTLDGYDFNADILKYLSYKSVEEKLAYINYLVNKGRIPSDVFVNRFFLKEYSRLSIDQGHYKEAVFALYKLSEKI